MVFENISEHTTLFLNLKIKIKSQNSEEKFLCDQNFSTLNIFLFVSLFLS